jgi:replicative DNA helicase
VSGVADQRAFLDRVGAFGPRRPQAHQLTLALAAVKPNTNVDTLPRDVFARIRAVMKARGISHRAMASLRGTEYGGSAHFGFSPSRTVVAGYAEILDDDDLRTEATSDMFWDRIVRIVPDGEEDVYDLTVPGPSSWLADSIVSHNSGALEQDADIVMFIHRDPLSEDVQAKGIAEIIVAKHRNGPVGKITLTWLEHLTLFRNYAREQ